MLFTGDLIDGKTAAEWGLALFSSPSDELDDRGMLVFVFGVLPF